MTAIVLTDASQAEALVHQTVDLPGLGRFLRIYVLMRDEQAP
ncbi:hypothetical protein [Actinomadura rubrisoli]|nr:hypothetical protein [Actinomadura rubrisoli]